MRLTRYIHDTSRTDENLQIETVHRGAGIEKMARRINVRTRVRGEHKARHICHISPGALRNGCEFNGGVAGVNRQCQ